MNLEVILHFIKKKDLYNVSIHRHFYLIRFINECARKSLRVLQFWSFKASQSFLVRFRRTYVLKNTWPIMNINIHSVPSCHCHAIYGCKKQLRNKQEKEFGMEIILIFFLAMICLYIHVKNLEGVTLKK